MNCITWNHDRHPTWNCNPLDSAGLVAISLESKSDMAHNQNKCSITDPLVEMRKDHVWVSTVTVILKLTNSVNEMFTMGILTTLLCQLQR